MRSQNRPSRTHGFTLIESLIALVVLSLGLFGLMQMQTRVMAETADSKTRTAAVNIAQEKIEELRSESYAAVVSGKDTVQAESGGTAGFTRTWTVKPKIDPPYREVSVTTRWTRPGEGSEDQDSSSVTLTTFIAQSAAMALETIGQDPELPPPPKGGGLPPTISVNSPYTQCVSSSNPCEVEKNTTIRPSFIVTDDTALSARNLTITASGNGAATSGSMTFNTSSAEATQDILTPNGNKKTFSVIMRADDGVNNTTVTLYFTT
ncbi:type IV pilus modification PilV family protein [Thiocapsa rosea]|uniref:Type IV pilus modification protein PilV n=1 Tax=Thiocapsa rosea TaxID=69360 RepID=A0A495VD02_9GAMM|nr:prepilin-type N-terminal cleavage/methylation domain-containing protein [Thiocapsa rosea]RKT47242.1 type IV pilus modification protein PilV [Thiocapsa rosea]